MKAPNWLDSIHTDGRSVAFPLYGCRTCFHLYAGFQVADAGVDTCPNCKADTLKEFAIPNIPAPGPCNLPCLVCARYGPWGIWDSATGVAICTGCRDKARADVRNSPLYRAVNAFVGANEPTAPELIRLRDAFTKALDASIADD